MEDVEAVDVSEVFVLVELKRQHLRGNLRGSRGRRSLEKYCNPSRILHIRKEQAMRAAQIQMAMAIFRDAGARRNSALLCRMQTAQTYLSMSEISKDLDDGGVRFLAYQTNTAPDFPFNTHVCF